VSTKQIRPAGSGSPSNRRGRRLSPAGLAERYGLRLIVQFGSVVEGRATAQSDLDVAVMADRPRRGALDWQARLVVALGEVLKTSREVDLTLLNGADSLISFRVASRGRLLYEAEPGLFQAFQRHASRAFDDDAPRRVAVRRWLEARLG
jgi:predicted nucleotidyltransferase